MTTCSRCGHAESQHRWFAIYRRMCVMVLTSWKQNSTQPCGCPRFVR